MHSLLLAAAFFPILCITYWFIKKHIFERDLPPNAPGYQPLLGHLHCLSRQKIDEQFVEFSKKVGPIFRIHMATSEVWYIITDYDLIRKVLHEDGDTFSYRPISASAKIFHAGHTNRWDWGIVFASGDRWKEQRRFSLAVLRDLGFGKAGIEEKVAEEVEKLLEWLNDSIGRQSSATMDVEMPIKFCVANIIASVALGVSYPKDDAEFLHLQAGLDFVFKSFYEASLGAAFAFPWLTKIPGMKRYLGVDQFVRANGELMIYWRRIVDEHKLKFDPDQEPRDFIDAYLQALHKRENGKEDMGYFSEEQLLLTLADLWEAGMETTAHTLRWAILYMLHNKQVAEKCFNEISEVVGLNRRPTLEDRASLPYVNATLNEVQRLANVADSAVDHTCVKDAYLGGYRIPAGSVLLPMLYAVHMNPNFFPEPTKFDPTRFMDEAGQLRKDEHLIPFGMGKRSCLGEGLARTELFLIFSSLMQLFKFDPADDTSMPTLEAQRGATLTPFPFQCKISPR